MPDYSNHLIASFLVLSAGYILYVQRPFLTTLQLTIFILFYFVGTVVLNPDLDLKNSKPSQKCGILCKPYTKMSKHRGIGHHWLYGTGLRILYVLIVIGFFAGLFTYLKFPLPDISFIVSHPFELFLAVLGIFISNILHTVIDALF